MMSQYYHRTRDDGEELLPLDSPSSDFRRELVAQMPRLRSVARALATHPDQADDLVAQTLLNALAAERQFEPGTNLKAWLTAILRNQFFSSRRRRGIEVETIGDIPEDARTTLPNQEHVVALVEVGTALKLLSAQNREIIVLTSIDGMTYEEAAHACGCVVGTVKSRLNRARAELKSVLAGTYPSVQFAPMGAGLGPIGHPAGLSGNPARRSGRASAT